MYLTQLGVVTTYEWLSFTTRNMSLPPFQALHALVFSTGDDDSNSTPSAVAAEQSPGPSAGRGLSRRGFLASGATAASAGVAGCTAQLPGDAASVESSTTLDGNTLIWDYPASAVQDDDQEEGIGYASIRFRALDIAVDEESVSPVLQFRLNSTVADIAAGESYQEYQADWFRFRIGVPRTYDEVSALRAFVQPPQWPEVQTTYGYTGALRELLVKAPRVNTEGTIIVEGRFRPLGTTLPRQLHCQFAVQASKQELLGQTVLADGRATFDVSELALPDGVTID